MIIICEKGYKSLETFTKGAYVLTKPKSID